MTEYRVNGVDYGDIIAAAQKQAAGDEVQPATLAEARELVEAQRRAGAAAELVAQEQRHQEREAILEAQRDAINALPAAEIAARVQLF